MRTSALKGFCKKVRRKGLNRGETGQNDSALRVMDRTSRSQLPEEGVDSASGLRESGLPSAEFGAEATSEPDFSKGPPSA